MGDQGEAHVVVADVDVGMVTGLFGQLADLVDEMRGRRRKSLN